MATILLSSHPTRDIPIANALADLRITVVIPPPQLIPTGFSFEDDVTLFMASPSRLKGG